MYCTSCGESIKNDILFCTNCGAKTIKQPQKKKSGGKISIKRIIMLLAIALILILGVFLLLIIDSESSYSSNSNYKTKTQKSVSNQQNYDQEEIASSVVNILCPSIDENYSSSGGSGTILDDTGLIITNSHIIPQTEDELLVDGYGCLVVLPDPTTGSPSEIYLAEPYVINGTSDKYDLAMMQIYDAYYDEETGSYAGSYPRKFPAFDDTGRCADENIKLGENIRVFGYPEISGGYSLTVTEGVVSSFPGDGIIMTSAKISHGNSGGLAVDANGCMIGIPSMVSLDEYESMGAIISIDLILEFIDESLSLME